MIVRKSAVHFVTETYLELADMIRSLRNATDREFMSTEAEADLICVLGIWADFHAYGGVWLGGELIPCDTFAKALTKRMGELEICDDEQE